MRILKFYADWCAPCKSLSEQMKSWDLGVSVENINIDNNMESAIEYGVRSVPTLILLDENHNVVERFNNNITEEKLKQSIAKLVA